MEFVYLSLLALGVMALATLASISTAFYLYRWRKLITENSALFVPEELVAHFLSLRTELAEFVRQSGETDKSQFAAIGRAHKNLASLSTQILESSATWQKALDERDLEVRKLRSGYDFEVFRRFIGRFARARLAIDELQTIPPTKELEIVSRLLDDALDECGVERFTLQRGEDYRSAVGVDDNPRRIPTSNPDDAFRIVETISPGFRSLSTVMPTILIPARVSIYVYQGEN